MHIESSGHYGVDSIHVSHDTARWLDPVKIASNCFENWHTEERGSNSHEWWLYTTQQEFMTSKDLKLRINYRLKSSWRLLKKDYAPTSQLIHYLVGNIPSTSRMRHTTCCIMFTRYSTVPSVDHFFILKRNQGLISPVGVLPSSCAVLYCILGAQLFLRPQHVSYIEHSLSQTLSPYW
jgi:hypothetical protein